VLYAVIKIDITAEKINSQKSIFDLSTIPFYSIKDPSLMKILFISNDLISGDLACKFAKEGHEVKLYIQEKERRSNFQNLVKQTSDWKKEIKWVGKNGLIFFDDVGFGEDQIKLRQQGYIVFGGGKAGDLLEINRVYGDEIFRECGLSTQPIYNFDSIDKAIDFLKENSGPWVIKQNDSAPKTLNYVGHFEDNRDTINLLFNYKKTRSKQCKVITLHKKIIGIEIATSRFFNGKNWVGPIEVNLEHKRFMAGNIGPTTSEMGTIAWYDDNEDGKLFKSTLGKLKSFLQGIDYRGVIDINCIINDDGIFPLEVTARVGSPIFHLQYEAYFTQWGNNIGEFFYKIAAGENFSPYFKKGFGVVILVAVPPFPYTKQLKDFSSKDQIVYFTDFSQEDFQHIHFEEISLDTKTGDYYISDDRGYILYATGFGKNMSIAQKKAYELINKIHIPMMIYRNDIGTKFIDQDMKKLRKMGFI